MKYLDHALPTPAENLALEETLLEECDADGAEVLRVWEPNAPFVVVGYGNSVATEVNVAACANAGVPILRRTSGGGTVVQLPGCLCYALILRVDHAPQLEGIQETNRYVLDRVAAALGRLAPRPIERAGDTDLVIAGRKFAGNSQRRKRRAVLFHGSLLLHADLTLMARLLPMPSREPAYRGHRSHEEFLINLELGALAVKQALRREWQASEGSPVWNEARVVELVRAQYGNPAWTLRA